MTELLYPDESYKIMGACFAVYREKGCGFLEPVYQECLEIEFGLQQIPYRCQVRIDLFYRGQPLRQQYIPDFICYDGIVVEIKAVHELTDEHRAQMINYLHATGCKLGLLINFGHYPRLQYERVALSR